jgi:hypothetical protein
MSSPKEIQNSKKSMSSLGGGARQGGGGLTIKNLLILCYNILYDYSY